MSMQECVFKYRTLKGEPVALIGPSHDTVGDRRKRRKYVSVITMAGVTMRVRADNLEVND